MSNSEFPFVSVVTPVHNGAKYLAKCIESVAVQTYSSFEHVIIDNASLDDTHRIATNFGARDPRIKVVRHSERFPIIQNWNRALASISPSTAYVWVLPADDMMMGDSLLAMMSIVRRNPSVGIVSSLRLRGTEVQNGGLPLDRNVFSGRDIVRMFLRDEVFAFSPTGSIFRRDLIDSRIPFYPENYIHADTAAFFNVLHRVDFGFVHDILMYSRIHEETVTSRIVNRRGTDMHDRLMMLSDYGPNYFDPDELEAVTKTFVRRYHRFLVRNAVLLRERAFFDYHLDALRAGGRVPGTKELIRAVAGEVGRLMIHPGRAIGHLYTRFEMISARDQIWSDRTAS